MGFGSIIAERGDHLQISTDRQNGLTPAEENIWYRLMTFHGVAEEPWTAEGSATAEKNRELWNRWALPALNPDRIAALGLAKLAPLTEEECQKIAGELDITELPDPNGAVAISAIQVSKPFTVAGLVFPTSADFEMAHFEVYADFEKAHFEADAGFRAAHFETYADFREAHLEAYADFRAAHFEAYADFEKAHFDGRAYFGEAHFDGDADFPKVHFDDDAVFEKAHFDAAAEFSDANFSSKTSFAGAAFAEPPQYHQAKLHQNTSFHEADFSRARDRVSADAESAWRRLKLIMSEAHAHHEELRFFAYEMSVRGRMAQWPVNWLYRLYEGLSDYGRSMGCPAGWLAALTLLFGLAYGGLLERPTDIDRGQFREDIASFTLGNALPAVGGLNPARRDLYKRLFDNGGGIDIPFSIELLSIVQASSGVVLFLLLSLGIRNRFRIK